MKLKFIAVLACVSSMVLPAFGQETGTLDKIKKDGVITLGIREASVPFSYYDNQQHVIGYSADMCALVVNAIKAKLQLPNLVVKEIPTTSQNRLPLIQNGTVDLECGSTTNNTDRAKQVAFSDTMFVIGTRLLGKTVVTTAGTTSEKILREMNVKKDMHMSVVSAKDHGDSFLALQSGRAVAFMMDDALLYGQLANSRDAADFEVVGTPQSFEAYALVMRKGDPDFKALVDATLSDEMKSGRATELYKKWFTSNIPPKGINLNFPMTDAVRDHFANPNDTPYQ
jgi:glutamate/aspartate transport system substrate-binding protein